MKRPFFTGIGMGIGIGVLIVTVVAKGDPPTWPERPANDQATLTDPAIKVIPLEQEVSQTVEQWPLSHDTVLVETTIIIVERSLIIEAECDPPPNAPVAIEPLVWDFTVLPPALPR